MWQAGVLINTKEESMAPMDDQMTTTLRQHNREFRLLETRHRQLDEQLDELIRHRVLTPEEEIHKKELQKQKLAAKDGMTRLIRDFQHDARNNGGAGAGRSVVSPPAGDA
jgi:uncharacterized protein YdcH (DUF465 family)